MSTKGNVEPFAIGNGGPSTNNTNSRLLDFSHLKYHWIDFSLTVALWLAGMFTQYLGSPFHRFFTERDPTLSYPFVSEESVPVWLLFFLCLIIPGCIIGLSQVIVRRRFRETYKKHKVAEFVLAQIVLFQALGLAMFLVSTSKVFFGRHRPNFFAYCDYKGYRTAVATGNYTDHPSGHAALSFAGLGFLSLFLYHLILSHKPSQRNHLWKAIVFAIPMFAAVIIAATRTRDYWHNFDDTLMGGVIGFACASLAFHINYSSKTSLNVEYIGDLFPWKYQDDDYRQDYAGEDEDLLRSSRGPQEDSFVV